VIYPTLIGKPATGRHRLSGLFAAVWQTFFGCDRHLADENVAVSLTTSSPNAYEQEDREEIIGPYKK
jgi:hypothetical protein